MEKTPLIVTCAAAFAAGVLAGHGFRAVKAAPSTDAAESRAHSAPGAAPANLAPAFANADDRIARLFTALKEPVALAKRFALVEATRDLTAADLPALVKRAESLPQDVKGDMMSALMARWFEVDAAAAELWMRARPESAWGIEAWARAAPESAIRNALAEPGNSRSKKLLAAAVAQLAGTEPAAQAERLRALPASALRDEVFADVLAKWCDTDPAAAFAALDEMAPGKSRDTARENVLLTWATLDPAAALAKLDALLPTLKAGVLGNDLVTHTAIFVARKDPRLVLDWLGGIPVEFREASAIGAATVWAYKEPTAALDWCMANGIEVARLVRMRDSAFRPGVLDTAIANSPEATLGWLEALSAGSERERLLERAMSGACSQTGQKQFFENAGNLPMRLFHQLPPDAQLRTAYDFGWRNAEVAPLTDLNTWAQSFAPGPARAEAVAGAIAAAYRRDASRVDALLASAATTADRDAALRGLATTLSDTAPAAAATRALGIGDSTLRRETLDTVMTGWLQRDPEASRAWLQDAPEVPPSWKAAWLR